MQFLNTAKTLALLSGALIIGLPLLGLLIALLFSANSFSAGMFRFSSLTVIITVLILAVPAIIGFVIIRVALQKPPQPLRAGIFYLVIGFIVAFFLSIPGILVGLLLILAGIFSLLGAYNPPVPAPANSYQYGANPAPPANRNPGPGLTAAPAPASGPESPSLAYFDYTTTGPRAQAQPAPPASPFYNAAFNQAVGLAQSGQKEQAYQALKRLEHENPTDTNLLLWLAYTAPNLEETRSYINRAARLDPDSPSLAQAHLWLDGQ
jgi:hypothetical protein